MDRFIQFMTNGRSVIWDTYHLMCDPKTDQNFESAILGMSPFKKSGSFVPKNGTLEKLRNVIDVTDTLSDHGAQIFIVFTIFCIVIYHFTRLLNFISLTYFSGAFFCGMLFHDTSEISGASKDLMSYLKENKVIHRLDSKILKTLIPEKAREEHSPLSKSGEMDYSDPPRPETESIKKLNQLREAETTFHNARLGIERIKRLKSNLLISRIFIRYPLDQMIKHLKTLEDDIAKKIYTRIEPLKF